ncbi:MAG: sterol desaturase family protein [Acidobacteria bacterium]|nr:sterol desaturase family protein [Acidobacteriota bacterium]
MNYTRSFDSASLAHGRAVKDWNAVTAVLSGCVPAGLLAAWQPPSGAAWLVGLLAGLLYANLFEYAYHRWLLHWPTSSFGRGHLRHHGSVGTPEEPAHVGLGGSPLDVLLMFVTNGVPMIALNLLLHARFAPGMLIAFAMYFIATEEVHWRYHLGGWLPPFLSAEREHHLAHHDIPNADYAIFVPIFDFVFRTRSRAPQS